MRTIVSQANTVADRGKSRVTESNDYRVLSANQRRARLAKFRHGNWLGGMGLYGHEFDDIIIPKPVIRPVRAPTDEYLTQPALDSIAFKIPNSIIDEGGRGQAREAKRRTTGELFMVYRWFGQCVRPIKVNWNMKCPQWSSMGRMEKNSFAKLDVKRFSVRSFVFNLPPNGGFLKPARWFAWLYF